MEKSLERIAGALERIANAAEAIATPVKGVTDPNAGKSTKATTTPDTKTKEKPAETAKGKTTKITKDQIIAKLRELIDRDGREAAFAVLREKGHGAGNATELKEEHYAAVMEQMLKLLAVGSSDPTV